MKGRNSPGNSSDGHKSSWNDQEYEQIIEGVKKVYNAKIKPLEVTYNFEGNTKKKTNIIEAILSLSVYL